MKNKIEKKFDDWKTIKSKLKEELLNLDMFTIFLFIFGIGLLFDNEIKGGIVLIFIGFLKYIIDG